MRIKIIADSTNDLSTELLAKNDIRRIPLPIILGDTGYRDGEDITPADVFRFASEGKGTPQTSAINVAEYGEIFQEELAKGAGAILHFVISSELSSCHQNATVAARDFDNVYPIDTMHLSTGGGWLVLYAADLVAQGLSAREIATKCEEKKQLISTSFVLDTLEYMRRGGRCSGFTALSAGLLNIKPCLAMRGGKLGVEKKYRGSLKKVIRQYLKDKLENQDDIDLSRAFITHTFYDDPSFIRETVEITKELAGFEEVLTTEAGCTVANHCGPKTLGVLFSYNSPHS